MGLHVEFCASRGWQKLTGALPEAEETMAYTRFVLEKGMPAIFRSSCGAGSLHYRLKSKRSCVFEDNA